MIMFILICRIVRLTSPNLNYCIIAGAMLIYGSVFVSVPFSTSLVVWDACCKVFQDIASHICRLVIPLAV